MFLASILIYILNGFIDGTILSFLINKKKNIFESFVHCSETAGSSIEIALNVFFFFFFGKEKLSCFSLNEGGCYLF